MATWLAYAAPVLVEARFFTSSIDWVRAPPAVNVSSKLRSVAGGLAEDLVLDPR